MFGTSVFLRQSVTYAGKGSRQCPVMSQCILWTLNACVLLQDDSQLMQQLEEAVTNFDPATLAATSKACTGG